MYQSHKSGIKGLAIATIILAALAILTSLIALVILGFVSSTLSSYYTTDTFAPYGYGNGYGYGYGYGHHGYEYMNPDLYDFYYDDFFDDSNYISSNELALIEFSLFLGKLFFGFAIVANIVPLIAGIISLKNVNRIEKYGSIFGWNIAGAIVGFLGFGLITTVLCIISAVFASKDKRNAQIYGIDPSGMQNGYPVQNGFQGQNAYPNQAPYGQATQPAQEMTYVDYQQQFSTISPTFDTAPAAPTPEQAQALVDDQAMITLQIATPDEAATPEQTPIPGVAETASATTIQVEEQPTADSRTPDDQKPSI